MAQSQKPTALGYAEIAKLVKGVTTAMAAGASGMKSIVGLTAACTAAEASTFANPGGATKLAANGFTLVDADSVVNSTTTNTDDTCELDHVFTWSGSQSVSGFAIENDDDDVVLMECCFNATIPGDNGDTLTTEGKMQFKLGS